jgi:hypothetical protein
MQISAVLWRAVALPAVGLALVGFWSPLAEAQRVYVSSWNPGDLSVVDADPASPTYHTLLASLNNATLGFPLAGAGIVVTPDRTRVYFVDGTQLSMIDTSTNALVDLNPDPASGMHGIPMSDAFGLHGGAGLAITPDGRRALVPGCNLTSTSVRVVDVDPASPTYHTTLTAVPIAGGCPYDVTIDGTGTKAWIGHGSRTFVPVIDLATYAVTNIALPGTSAAVFTPSTMALTPDGTRAYVTWFTFLFAIDTATNVVVDLDPSSSASHRILNCIEFTTAAEAIAITPDGTRAYVTCRATNISAVNDTLVKAVDLGDHSVSEVLQLGFTGNFGQFYGGQLVRIAPDGNRAYLGTGGSVSVVDLVPESATYQTIVATIAKPGTAAGLAISTGSVNQPPLADVGPDQTVHPGTAVGLSGNQSADPDGHTPLGFAWAIVAAPDGSLAALDDPTSVTPTFTPDQLGTYRIRLVVTDTRGLASAPDEVVISTENSAPVADAGPDQQLVQIGTLVELDGSQSFDDDGDDISYAWSLSAKPASSSASLSDLAAVHPTFVADLQGEYRARLTVTDELGATSEADDVVISFQNLSPVADAGDNQAVRVGTILQLDGSGSFDPNLDVLTYHWSLTTQPAGSAAALGDASAQSPTLVPDVAGTDTASLVVSDGQATSPPDVVTIQATSDAGAIVAILRDAVAAINGLDPGDFKNANMQGALTNKLAAVIADVEAGRLQDALDKLEHDVIAKTDGCAETGAPDRNDWLKNSAAQTPVYARLREAVDLIRALL